MQYNTSTHVNLNKFENTNLINKEIILLIINTNYVNVMNLIFFKQKILLSAYVFF